MEQEEDIRSYLWESDRRNRKKTVRETNKQRHSLRERDETKRWMEGDREGVEGGYTCVFIGDRQTKSQKTVRDKQTKTQAPRERWARLNCCCQSVEGESQGYVHRPGNGDGRAGVARRSTRDSEQRLKFCSDGSVSFHDVRYFSSVLIVNERKLSKQRLKLCSDR